MNLNLAFHASTARRICAAGRAFGANGGQGGMAQAATQAGAPPGARM